MLGEYLERQIWEWGWFVKRGGLWGSRTTIRLSA